MLIVQTWSMLARIPVGIRNSEAQFLGQCSCSPVGVAWALVTSSLGLLPQSSFGSRFLLRTTQSPLYILKLPIKRPRAYVYSY